MFLSKLIDKLKIFPSFEILQKGADCQLAEYRFINRDDSSYNTYSLYIGVVPNAQKFIPAISLLTSDHNQTLPEGATVLFLNPEDLTASLNLIADCFMEAQKNEIAFSHILYLLMSHAPLHDAINMASSFMKRSLVLTDLSFKVIDYSTDVPVTDALWLANIERGFCTSAFVSAIHELLPSDSLPQDGTPFIVNCNSSDEQKLCVKLIYEEQHIGYLILLDNRKGLLDFHYEYLPRISAVMVEFLKQQPSFESYFVDVAANILISLLKGENPEMSKQRLLAAGIDFPSELRCVIFMPDTSSKHIQAYLERNLKLHFPSGHIFPYGLFVVALISANSFPLLLETDSDLSIMSHVNEVGVSSIFSDISQLPAMFREAARACHLSHRLDHNSNICLYEDYRFYDLLTTCPDTKLLASCIHPAFETLNSYDIHKETDLLTTFKAYITNDMNAKETANALFLHRNTLKYRLDKIQELTGIDYNDPETKFQLSFSMRVNRLLKIY